MYRIRVHSVLGPGHKAGRPQISRAQIVDFPDILGPSQNLIVHYVHETRLNWSRVTWSLAESTYSGLRAGRVLGQLRDV